MGVVSIWRAAGSLAVRRPFLFLAISVALAATDVLLWRMGLFDAPAARPGGGAMAAFVAIKLALLCTWALAALRLAEAPDLPLGATLSLDGRQVRWLAGALSIFPLLLALRLVLTKLAALALPEPRTALIAGLALYLLLSLALLVRLLPGWVGALLGDRKATLPWSWRATRGHVLASAALVVTAIAPPIALHVGLNLFWLAEAPPPRLLSLVADGALMALAVLVAMASYRALWLRAKAAP